MDPADFDLVTSNLEEEARTREVPSTSPYVGFDLTPSGIPSQHLRETVNAYERKVRAMIGILNKIHSSTQDGHIAV